MRPLALVLILLSSVSVLAATDVAVVYPVPARVALGSPVGLTFSITQHGPQAMAVEFTIELSDGVRFEPPANCSASAQPLRCATHVIAPGAPFFQSISVQAPAAPGPFTVRVAADGNSVAMTSQAVNLPDVFTGWASLQPTNPGATVQATGIVGNVAPLTAAHDVRLYIAAANGSVTAASVNGQACEVDAGAGICRIPTMGEETLDFEATIKVDDVRSGGKLVLSASATSDAQDVDPTNNGRLAEARISQWISVVTTADSGAGSLRAAIEKANADGCQESCRIVFEIAEPLPASGWYTIEPLTPLPALTALRAIIDATTLPDANPNGPEVLLDGRLAGDADGLRIATPCEGGVLGLAIGNFVYGIIAEQPTTCLNGPGISISKNYLGVDPTGVQPLPNLRGVGVIRGFANIGDNLIRANRRSGVWTENASAAIRHNRIELNGASGVFCGPNVFACAVSENFIAQNAEMGVSVVPGAKISLSQPGGGADIRMNSMFANGGLPIDIGLDGPTPPRADDTGAASNPPVILSARYDAATNNTVITAKVETKPLGPYGNTYIIDFYANDSAAGDGEQFLAERTISPGTEIVATVKGDLTGRWINATSTRVHFFAKTANPNSFAGGESWTSEFSPAVQVTR